MSRTKRMILSAAAALAILVALAGIGYAVYYLTLEVKNNYFRTGVVAVSIRFEPGDGDKVDLSDEIFYEPGMTVRGDFTVYSFDETDGSATTDQRGMWYSVYFTALQGPLADVMEARILDGERELASGRVREMTSAFSSMAPRHMPPGETSHTLTLELHYPESAGNATQGATMEYALGVTAVQRTENPDGRFD